MDTQYQRGLPVNVLLSVTYHDDKPVAVTDATKHIVLFQIPNNRDLSESFTKQELSPNATAKFIVKTSKKDESGFILKVGHMRPNTVANNYDNGFLDASVSFVQAKYMDEDSEVGYLYPSSNVDPMNLEIKILTKLFVFMPCYCSSITLLQLAHFLSPSIVQLCI